MSAWEPLRGYIQWMDSLGPVDFALLFVAHIALVIIIVLFLCSAVFTKGPPR